jgi:hypothetical protein
MAIPKITKAGNKLKECRKGQIVKFPTNMAQVDVEEIAESYGFRIWFYEPGDPEYNKHGRNIVRLQ